jgi:hypothetical protein
MNVVYPNILCNRVVMRTIEDGRTDNRTMAVGSFMTWTHCSVRYKVTSGVNRRVRVDTLGPRGCTPSLPSRPSSAPRGRNQTSVRTQCVRADALPPSPPLPPSLSIVRADGLRPHLRGRSKFYFILFIYLFW